MTELFVDLDRSSPVPLYFQVAQQIEHAISEGDLAPGDLLAVAATGAYCRAMASTYNQVGRPPVVAVTADGARQILRRETPEDLLLLDVDA